MMSRVACLPDEGVASGDATPAEWQRWFAATPAMMHSIDAQGRVLAVSDFWLAKLGYQRREVVGRLSSDFLTAASREYAVKFVLPEFFRRGRCENIEYQMVGKDGRIIDVLLSAVVRDEAMGRGRASLAVITDVTARKVAERKLAQSEARYRGLVEDQSELVSLATADGRLSYVNLAYARHYGAPPEAMVGRSLFDFVPPEGHRAVADHLRRACEADHGVSDENQVVLANGERRWMSWRNRALKDSDGKVTAIHSVGRDIEDRVATERRLKESETRYRLLAEHSTDMVFELDRDLKRVYVSPACREMFGYEPEEMIGGFSGLMAHPDDAERATQILKSLLSGRVDRETSVLRRAHRDGRWIWIETRYRAVKDAATGETTGIVASARDISARKAVEDRLQDAYRRLEAVAREDGLTGLANRRTFDDALMSECRRARRERRELSLIMIDVDDFKLFNDRYGHPAGDESLRRIGQMLLGAVFRSGDLAARYGGEEFVLLLPDTDERGAAVIAERIREAAMGLAIEHQASPRGMMTISAGVASFSQDSTEDGPQALVQSADQALYRAKRSGRNIVICGSDGGVQQAQSSEFVPQLRAIG